MDTFQHALIAHKGRAPLFFFYLFLPALEEVLQVVDGLFGFGMIAGTDLPEAKMHQRLVMVEHARVFGEDLAQKSGSGSPRGHDKEPLGMGRVPVGCRKCRAQVELIPQLLPAFFQPLNQDVQSLPALTGERQCC